MSHLVECRLVLPTASLDNAVPMRVIHGKLRFALIDAWGGVTVSKAEGYWIDPSDSSLMVEPVTCYDVAIEDTIEGWNLFRRIAVDFGRKARQKSVYVRDWRGRVEMIDLSREEN